MRLWIVPLAAFLAGCASTPEVRGLADKTAPFVSSLQAGTGEFVESQNRLNQQNAARLDHLVSLASPGRADVREQRLVWVDAGDRVRLATFEAATARSVEDIVGGLETKAVSAPEINSDALEAYAKTLKALADVSAKPKSSVALRELLGFGQEVWAKYAELRKKAEEASKSTAPAAGATDNATKSAAQAVPK